MGEHQDQEQARLGTRDPPGSLWPPVKGAGWRVYAVKMRLSHVHKVSSEKDSPRATSKS